MARRAIVVVLDGLGAGNAPDAAEFGDEGANTLANTARAVGGLDAPNLRVLGLGNIDSIEGVPPAGSPRASHGLMVELSAAKATLAGHWEMMGLVLDDPLPTYPDGFPEDVLARFEDETGRGSSGTGRPRGRRSSRRSGPSRRGREPGSSTPRPITSSRSPQTPTTSPSKSSTGPAKRPTRCS
jgi:phosphopentomutase